MKALLFRFVTGTIALFSLFIQIEIASFDAIWATLGAMGFIIFFTDTLTWSTAYGCEYYKTEYGSISWILFGNKKTK